MISICLYCSEIPKFLVNWIANNWRTKRGDSKITLNIHQRPIELVWRNRKQECEEELKEILQVDELDANAPEYFQQRLAATKIVMDRLTIPEREALDAEVRKIKETGHTPEMQQQYVLLQFHVVH